MILKIQVKFEFSILDDHESSKETAVSLPTNLSYLFGLHQFLSPVAPSSFIQKKIMSISRRFLVSSAILLTDIDDRKC